MNDPKITLEAILDNVAIPKREINSGTVSPTEKVNMKFQVWNNRWGSESVNNAINCFLIIRTSFIDELMPILNNSIIKIDNIEQEIPTFIKDKVALQLRDLSGHLNDGMPNNSGQNFTEVSIEFTVPQGFKSGNKNLIFDIEYNKTNF